MEKAFALILFVVLLGVALYALPLFLAPLSGGSAGGNFGGSTRSPAVIAVSGDGGQTFIPAAVHAPRNPDITMIDSGTKAGLLFAGSTAGLLVTRDGGANWYPWSDLEKQVDDRAAIYDIARNPVRPNEAYVAAFHRGEGAVYRTTDNFFTLTKIWDANDIAPYALAADGAYLYLGLSDGRVIRYGFSSERFEVLAALGSAVSDLSIRGNGATIYAATKARGVFGSFDGGRTFSRLGEDMRSYPGAIRISAVVPDSGAIGRVYAASLAGLLRSDDSGGSWVVVSDIIAPDSPVSAIEVRSDGRILAASGEKLYTSDDRGATWRIMTPLGDGRSISAIDILADGSTVVIGTAAK